MNEKDLIDLIKHGYEWVIANIPSWVYITVVVHLAVLGTVAYLILLERKVASWVQDRIGPNRVGLGFGIIPGLKDMHMFGLGQPLADGLKFIVKEDYAPKGVDKILFTLAPGIMLLAIIISIAVIPWGGIKRTTVAHGEPVAAASTIVEQTTTHTTYQWDFQIAKLDIGVLFVVATLSLAIYGVVIGGWASNNKYSFLGGLRATVNMISYEIPMGLCILVVVLMFGTLDLGDIVSRQAHYWMGFIPAWNVFNQPITFLLFLICIHAEANRAPFDLAEAEQELVGGYHTEYSSMRFALFFLGEYAGMITTSAVCVALFFGGWHLPWIEWLWPALGGNVDPNNPAVTTSLAACIVRAVVLFTKTILVLFVFMWVRWSLPRVRFDQLMSIAWRGLIPITLALTVATAILVWSTGGATLGGKDGSLDAMDGKTALIFFVMNLAIVAGTVVVGKILPTPPNTNRRLRVANSRYNQPVAGQV